MLLLQLLINGIQLGALYALTAAGFSLIFGSTRIFHFAHGSAFAIAAYLFYFFYAVAGAGWPVAALAATAAAVVFGVAVDRFIYAPIQRHEGSFFTVFVASFGVAIVVQNLIGVLYSPQAMAVTPFFVIMLVLVLRPQGLFGELAFKKV